MEIRTIVASAVIFVAVYAACAANAAPNDNFSALAFAANSCGAEFYKIIDDDNKNENVLFSPFAVFALCAALFEGSSGKTSGDYLNAFDFAADADKRKTMFSRRLKPYTNSKRAINLKNSIWVSSKNKLLKRYKNDASDYYYIGVYEDINFGLPQSAAKINKWIKQNSFKNGVPEVSEDLFYADTRAVLLNICEFEGKWLGAFDKNGSVEDDFFISGKDKTTVKLLRQEGSYYYYDNKRVQVLKMEFDANSSLSMIIILPKQNKISFAEQFLFKKTVPQIISLLSRQNAVVYVPEFQTASFLDLADALYYAGVQTSDYSKMSDSLLQVSNFLHYSSIQIDYEMKAAPSAVIEIDGDVGKIERDAPPVVFRADHPFIYAIIDESGGEILLMGKMLNPSN